MALEVTKIRRDFPIFQQAENDGWVYLDSAATSQKPRSVLAAMNRFYEQENANAHRSSYALAERATLRYEAARERVRRFINAAATEEIIFTRNTTESINLAAFGWAGKFLRPGDEVLISEMEHHSNLVPWQRVCHSTGAQLKFVAFDEQGRLLMDQFHQLLTPRTRLVAVAHMSNSLGAIHPVEEIIAAAHRAGSLVLIDAAQSAPHSRLDVQALDADFIAFSGHKMLGPLGIGVLYGRRSLLEEMDPLLFGGSMIGRVEQQKTTWNDLPWKLEAGTQNLAGALGLASAMDYLDELGMEAIEAHDLQLGQAAMQQLSAIPGIRVYGPPDAHGPVVSFNLENIHPHDLATFLDQERVAVRSGHHCCQLVMKRLNVAATARASFYLYNDEKDVRRLAAALNQAKDYFKKWL
ncbi:MAG: putative cysteine desulfurase [bacterium ADurb.Bin478]|nr:MAG: putative cysteine desulfurase [bacterium ADurb.Bin478]